jgi:hypothetical protein
MVLDKECLHQVLGRIEVAYLNISHNITLDSVKMATLVNTQIKVNIILDNNTQINKCMEEDLPLNNNIIKIREFVFSTRENSMDKSFKEHSMINPAALTQLSSRIKD